MSLLSEVWFLFVLVACVWKTQGQRIITWPSITNRYNSVYIRSMNSSITQPLQLSFNVETDYLHDICEDIAYLQIKMPKSQKTTFAELINYRVKISDFIQGAMKTNFFKLMNKSVEKYSNLPRKCPIPADMHIYFRNFTFDIVSIPIVISEINFLVILKLVRPNGDFVSDLLIKGRIECKERKRFECGIGVKRG